MHTVGQSSDTIPEKEHHHTIHHHTITINSDHSENMLIKLLRDLSYCIAMNHVLISRNLSNKTEQDCGNIHVVKPSKLFMRSLALNTYT